MGDVIGLCASLAPFVMVIAIVKMSHDRKMRALSLQNMSDADQRALADMHAIAQRLETRIGNLERILDAEVAGWRARMPV